jgi:hypothetical protein
MRIQPIQLDHPVARALWAGRREREGQWHKLCALVMHTCGLTELEIRLADVEEFLAAYGEDGTAVAEAVNDRVFLRVTRNARARQQWQRRTGDDQGVA